MLRKFLQFFTVLLLILGCGVTPRNAKAQFEVNAGGTTVYLPLVSKPWLNSTFGVEVHSFDETVATRAQEAKNTWVRINALKWSVYQPNNSSDFIIDSTLEGEIAKANQSGMKVILIIHKAPLWAREYADSVCGPIKQDMLDEFANFMMKVVQRYSQPPFNVLYYELWNEPDAPISRNYPDPNNKDESNIPYGCWGVPGAEFFGGGNYAEMLKTVTPAMKSMNPNVKIVLGGLLLGCDPYDGVNCGSWQKEMGGYFEGILQAGGGNYFDVVSYHGYSYYGGSSPIQNEYNIANWKNSGGMVEGKLAFLKQVMTNYGIDKPIILSEAGLLGWDTPDYEQHKAEYVVWLYTRNWSKGIMATMWYTLDKGGWLGTGLLDVKNNPTSAFYAYKTMTNTLYGANFSREVANDVKDVRIFEFEKGFKVWALFSMDGTAKSIDLSAYTMMDIEAFDLFGNLCGGNGTDCALVANKLSFDLPVFLRFH